MFVADHDDDVGVLFFAQVTNGVARGFDRVCEMQRRFFDQSPEIVPGNSKGSDADAIHDEDARRRETVRVRAQHRIADGGETRLHRCGSVVGLVIAQRHRIDHAVEPRPFRTAVFVRPGRRAFVDHVAAGEHECAALFFAPEVSDGPRNSPLILPSLGVERLRVRVIVGEVQQRHASRPRVHVRRACDQEQRQKQRAPKAAPFATKCRTCDHFLRTDLISLMAASRPLSLAIF